MKSSKILVASFISFAFACAVFACSNAGTSDPTPAAPDTADAASEASLPVTATDENDSSHPAKPAGDGSDGLGNKGGIFCQTSCQKAGCPDLEACEARCAKGASQIPAACQSASTALQTCAEKSTSWKCEDGEAKTSDCLSEALTLFNCVLGALVDGGLGTPDASMDGSF
jgi:hypothetical protein